jgi:RHS repeat-associated protein
VLSSTAPNGAVTSNTYDWAGRVLKSTDPLGRVTSHSYDVSGNQIAFVDGNNNLYTWGYDLLNRKINEAYLSGATETWSYYPYGLLKSYTKRDGNIKTYQYDNRNRAIAWSWTSGYATFASYDAGGRTTEIQNGVGDLKYQYDTANEVAVETQASLLSAPVTINYTYMADGQRASLQIPSLNASNCPYAVTYAYTGRQQVKTIGYNGALAASYTYDLAGNRLTRTLANNTVAKYTYDADNQLTVLEEDQGATAVLRNHYTYDANSRITAVKHDQSGSGMTFGYDLANQVAGYVNQGPGPGWGPEAPKDTEAFTYDNAANRTSLTDNGATLTWSPNGLNQYTSITLGSTVDSLSYDLNGNLTSYNGVTVTVTVTYNAENQVESISSDGFTMYLDYDPLGRCVWAGNSDDESYYVYDGLRSIVQWKGGNGRVDNLFVYGVGTDEHLLTMPVYGRDEAPVEPYYFCQEPNGNVIALTDTTGNFFEFYQYDLFGNPFIYQENKTQLQQSQVGNLYMFQGRPYFSDFGVYNFRHRTYSPSLGRFLQGDPIGFSGGNNLYAFAGNNPVNGADPLGLETIFNDGGGDGILLPPIVVDGYPRTGWTFHHHFWCFPDVQLTIRDTCRWRRDCLFLAG